MNFQVNDQVYHVKFGLGTVLYIIERDGIPNLVGIKFSDKKRQFRSDSDKLQPTRNEPC